MTKQTLEDKAITIKGKKYVLVSDRILDFNDIYKNGSVMTELVSGVSDDMVVVKATITPNVDAPQRVFTGYSQAKWGDGYINKTSALENAETSAVGRALAMMGIGVIDSIASIDEINKAESDVRNDEEYFEVGGDRYVHMTGISKKTGKPYDSWLNQTTKKWIDNTTAEQLKSQVETEVDSDINF